MVEKLLEFFVEAEDEDYEEYNKLAKEKPKYSSVFRAISRDSQRHATYFRRLLLGDDVKDFYPAHKKLKVPRLPDGHGFYDAKIKEEILAVKSYLAFGDEHKEYKPLMRSIVSDELRHIGYLKDIRDGKDINIEPISNPIAFDVLLASSVGSIIATLIAAAIISYDVRESGKKSLFHKATTAVVEKSRKNPPVDWEVTGSIGRFIAIKDNKKVVITKTKDQPYKFKFYKGDNKLIDVEYEDSDTVLDLTSSLVTEEPDKILRSVENVYKGEPIRNQSVFLPMLLTRNPKHVIFEDSVEDIVQLNPYRTRSGATSRSRKIEHVPIVGKLIFIGRAKVSQKLKYKYLWCTVELPDGTRAVGPIYTEEHGINRPLPNRGETIFLTTGILDWKEYNGIWEIAFSCTLKQQLIAPYTIVNKKDLEIMYDEILKKIGQAPGPTNGIFPRTFSDGKPAPIFKIHVPGTPTGSTGPMILPSTYPWTPTVGSTGPMILPSASTPGRDYYGPLYSLSAGYKVYIDKKMLSGYIEEMPPLQRQLILRILNVYCGDNGSGSGSPWSISEWESVKENEPYVAIVVVSDPIHPSLYWPNNKYLKDDKSLVFLSNKNMRFPMPYPSSFIYRKTDEINVFYRYYFTQKPVDKSKVFVDKQKYRLLYPGSEDYLNRWDIGFENDYKKHQYRSDYIPSQEQKELAELPANNQSVAFPSNQYRNNQIVYVDVPDRENTLWTIGLPLNVLYLEEDDNESKLTPEPEPTPQPEPVSTEPVDLWEKEDYDVDLTGLYSKWNPNENDSKVSNNNYSIIRKMFRRN